MALLSTLTLLGYCAALATAAPASTRGTESGGGIAPWAGQHSLPPPRPESREATFSATAAASQVPVGTIITRCTVPGTVALTFDDGPHPNTDEVLNHLRNANMRATFFVNGDNFNYILDQPGRDRINRMIREGHQIGSHTWSHPDLTTLDRNGIADQMSRLESALRTILGYWPTYMRPPFFATNDLVLNTMRELGYHVIHADIDTLDWANQSEGGIEESVRRFRDGLNAGGSIALAHDVHFWTARRLTPAMIDEVRRRGLRAVPVGECLGDPQENWYRR